MAGLINPEDIEEVRQRARIDDVVSAYVTLKPAGVGTLKGLCPFHDEKTASLQVTPARGLYYCFGCGKGGDTVNFVQEINNLSFPEAIEFLADKYGVQLRYSAEQPAAPGGSRLRLLEANAAAASFFADCLTSRAGLPGRTFLAERGFDQAAAEMFGIGFAPRGGHDLANHLRQRGFRDDELIQAGLVRSSGWDYFQARLLWPIRDAGQAVLGFGARRLFDDDRMPAKYINTPETPLYKKSHVLFGLDLARSAIGSTSQAVIVEGYTDVMACHLAGVATAVASCGTAFGADHARMVQRLMGDQTDAGQVIFTFDGDAAGVNAALKVHSQDSLFTASTWAAIDPTGLDPCDLRQRRGDQAIRDLISQKVPLYQFVMRNTVAKFPLDHADGRLAAVRAAAPLVNSIRDESRVGEYVKDLAGIVGVDQTTVQREIRAARRRQSAPPDPAPPVEAARPTGANLPHPTDRRLAPERDTLKLMLQHPDLFDTDPAWSGLTQTDFTHPAYRAIFRVLATVSLTDWPQAVFAKISHDDLRQLAIALSVEPPLTTPNARYAAEYAARLRLDALQRDLDELKSRLQRTNPVTDTDTYQAMFAQMVDLEVQRKQLLQRVSGE